MSWYGDFLVMQGDRDRVEAEKERVEKRAEAAEARVRELEEELEVTKDERDKVGLNKEWTERGYRYGLKAQDELRDERDRLREALRGVLGLLDAETEVLKFHTGLGGDALETEEP